MFLRTCTNPDIYFQKYENKTKAQIPDPNMCNKTKSLSIKLKKDRKTKEHCLVFQFLLGESLENPVDTSQKVLLLPYIFNC